MIGIIEGTSHSRMTDGRVCNTRRTFHQLSKEWYRLREQRHEVLTESRVELREDVQ